jgi:hypothetical protein
MEHVPSEDGTEIAVERSGARPAVVGAHPHSLTPSGKGSLFQWGGVSSGRWPQPTQERCPCSGGRQAQSTFGSSVGAVGHDEIALSRAAEGEDAQSGEGRNWLAVPNSAHSIFGGRRNDGDSNEQ